MGLTAIIDDKILEELVLDAENIPMKLQSGDKIKLQLELYEGKHAVSIVMPWHNIYVLREYASEQEARKGYNEYLDKLRRGCTICIGGNGVEIVKPR